jgi:FkbM family methyltransferase
MSFARSLRFVLGHPLNRHRKLSALAGVLGWQLRTRLSTSAQVVPWVDGTRLVVRRGDTGLTGNVYCGLHEYAEMAFVLHALRADDVFVDIGANLGSYTVLACGARGARGFCFEPVPLTYSRLVENLRANGLEGCVSALNCGVGESQGTLRFSSGHDTGNHVLAQGEETLSVEVPVLPLDSLLGGAAPTLMKIDVEGFELPVLRGAAKALRAQSLSAIVMEVNGSGRRYGFSDEDLLQAMQSYGFGEYTYDPRARELAPWMRSGPREGSGIFVRDVESVRARLRGAPAFAIHGLSI